MNSDRTFLVQGCKANTICLFVCFIKLVIQNMFVIVIQNRSCNSNVVLFR